MSAELILIGLLAVGLIVMSQALTRLKNRIRRLEREVGLDYLPPADLDGPPEEDGPVLIDHATLCGRVQRIESHLVL